MWGSMTRKPGQPSEYMGAALRRVPRRAAAGPVARREAPGDSRGARLGGDPQEAAAEGLQVRRRLLRLAQRVQPQDRLLLPRQPAGDGLLRRRAPAPSSTSTRAGCAQGLLADAQCFTLVQLQRGLARTVRGPRGRRIRPRICGRCRARSAAASRRSGCSGTCCQAASRRASRRRRCCTSARASRRTSRRPSKLGMQTALFAGDKESLQATAEQLKDPATRPDVLLTELGQVTEVIAPV